MFLRDGISFAADSGARRIVFAIFFAFVPFRTVPRADLAIFHRSYSFVSNVGFLSAENREEFFWVASIAQTR